MKGNPLVSVLIPCYNCVAYVDQCIRSALDQTYSDIEVIVIDDGSTDGSNSVIESYGNRICAEFWPNRGPNPTRNCLLQHANGVWLQYLDADDYLLPDKVQRHMAFIDRTPDVDVVYSPVTLLFESGEEHTVDIEQVDDHVANFVLWGPFATHSIMLRAEAVRAIGGWKEDQACCQEHELLLRLFRAGHKFACLNENIGAIYRQHAGTVSKKNLELVTRIRMDLTDALESHLKRRGELNPLRQRCIARARFESARSMYALNCSYARYLMKKVLTTGSPPSGAAAPLRYRMALALLGFDGAERLAKLARELRGAPEGFLPE